MSNVASPRSARTSEPPKSTRKRREAKPPEAAAPQRDTLADLTEPERVALVSAVMANLEERGWRPAGGEADGRSFTPAHDTLDTIRGLAEEARTYVDQIATLFAIADGELEESCGRGTDGADQRLAFTRAVYGVVRDLECIVATCDRNEPDAPATAEEPS